VAIDTDTMTGVEQVLIEGQWCQQYPSHSTGDLVFGADGMLYLSAGDGASFNFADWGQDGSPVNPCGDPPDGVGGPNNGSDAEGGALRSQDIVSAGDPVTYDGAVLRLDVSGPAVQVPADNPLVGNAEPADDFIVAMGLRNPYRLNDRPGTDEIWIADVGWGTWEELNRIASPAAPVENFGWPCYEGGSGASNTQSGYQSRDLCGDVYADNLPAGLQVTPSFYAYRHADKVVPGELCGTGSSSVTGVEFEGGVSGYPAEYADALFFADSSRKCIWTIFADASGDPDPTQRAPLVSQSSGRVVDLQMGPDGSLYYVDFDGGRVLRIEYFPVNVPPTASFTATPMSGPSPLTVDLDGSGSSDPEDAFAALLLTWDLDGDGQFDDASGATAQVTFVSAGARPVALRVEDTLGGVDIAQMVINVDNGPPQVQIDAPLSSDTWAVGDTIAFSGQATDPESGLLGPEQLSWEIILHHCEDVGDCHTHPVTTVDGVASGEFMAPDHEMVSYLELKLTATDLPPVDWFDPAWTKRRRLVFDNSGQSGDLVDFPVLVRLDPGRIDYGSVNPDGSDLRFADAFGNPLAYDIEEWVPGGESIVWVRVPLITGGSASDSIFMYYGNPGAASAEDPTSVWIDYAAVWHQDPALADASGNGNHGANVGSTDIAGHLGRARFFDGASRIDVADHPSLRLVGTATLEAWVRIEDPDQAGAPRVMSKKTPWNGADGYNMEYKPGENNATTVGGGGDYIRADGVDLDTGWHYLATTANGGSGSVYVDGVDLTTDSTLGPIVAGTTPFAIGSAADGGATFYGTLDEVRVSPVERSADWIAAQYLSMSDAFLSVTAEELPQTLAASASVEIHPRTVALTLESFPSGLELVLGGDQEVTPFTHDVIIGSNNSVDAPDPQVQFNALWNFESWSDGGAIAHNMTAPDAASAELLASFAATKRCDDGLDNDGDGKIDWDGAGVGEPDPNCGGNPDRDGEGRCGLGFEWAPFAVLAWMVRRRRRARA
jgi:glucose/arabinose dehydrogenase/PKD repeat protein